jgi:hypothetical protein
VSWEDAKCPCGGRKERETLVCGECETHLAGTMEMQVYRTMTTDDRGERRWAAIRLLAMARRRKGVGR